MTETFCPHCAEHVVLQPTGRPGTFRLAWPSGNRHYCGEVDREPAGPTWTAKLCYETAHAIRTAYAAHPESQRTIAERYGVSHATIGCVLRGLIWKEPVAA